MSIGPILITIRITPDFIESVALSMTDMPLSRRLAAIAFWRAGNLG